MTAELIQVITLVYFPQDLMNRVYDPNGIAPTIHACGGGNTEPKILIEGARE